jgi:hypothetical protein
MQFARGFLRDDYERASILHRLAIRLATPVILAVIFDWLVPPHVYTRAGVVASSREAWALYREARSSAARRRLRHDSVGRISRFMSDVGILDVRSRRIWAAADLLA